MIEKENDDFLYTDINDFYKKRKIIKLLYDTIKNKRAFKTKVYSKENMPEKHKDIIWEYLNDNEIINFRKYLKH